MYLRGMVIGRVYNKNQNGYYLVLFINTRQHWKFVTKNDTELIYIRSVLIFGLLWDFFWVVAVSILLFGCIIWASIKCLEKTTQECYKTATVWLPASYLKPSKLDEQNMLSTAGEIRANCGLLHMDILADLQRLLYICSM